MFVKSTEERVEQVVAIAMTEDGPEIDPLGSVEVHPAAELFPAMSEIEFDTLVSDIRRNGQREPVVLTLDGRLLDGRSRWRACATLGIEPRSVAVPDEPWTWVLSTSDRLAGLTGPQRALVGARAYAAIGRPRSGGDRRSPNWRTRLNAEIYDGVPPPPDRRRIVALLGVSGASVFRAGTVLREGSPALQDAVEQGLVPVFTAARVATELPRDRQDEFVRRVGVVGVDASRTAADMGVSIRTRPGPPGARTDNRSPVRHRYVTASALRSLGDSLDALRMVLAATEGLDPAITPEEAARWVDGLSKGRRSLHGVIKLLTQRKESTP